MYTGLSLALSLSKTIYNVENETLSFEEWESKGTGILDGLGALIINLL